MSAVHIGGFWGMLALLGSLTSGCTDGGTAGMSTDGGGGDGGGMVCSPEGAFDGAPVTAAAGQWTWVDVPQAICRNGTATGFCGTTEPSL